jgi:hypothetical protein
VETETFSALFAISRSPLNSIIEIESGDSFRTSSTSITTSSELGNKLRSWTSCHERRKKRFRRTAFQNLHDKLKTTIYTLKMVFDFQSRTALLSLEFDQIAFLFGSCLQPKSV